MSTDYFAHHIYGVALDKKICKHLDALLVKVKDDDQGASGLCESELVDKALEGQDDLISKLIVRYGAPAHAHIHHSGSDDARPGRCNTNSDCWLLGLGVHAFPLPTDVSPEFRAAAQWHSWVTSG